MLAQQRQEQILADIRSRGAVRVADLVVGLDVSDMTIRRDIADLARRGLVRRVHGGAVDVHHATHEPGFGAKRKLATAEKAVIAREAITLVTPGSAIALSAGTTTHLLASLLAADRTLRPLTVVTNSLPAAEALHHPEDRDLTVVLTGGTRTPSDALVGPVATRAIAALRVDILFLGVHGMDADAGLTTPNLLEAETDRALIAAAGTTVVLADRSKWGAVGLSRIADLAEVDALICDDGLPEEAAAALRDVVGRPRTGDGVGGHQDQPPDDVAQGRGSLLGQAVVADQGVDLGQVGDPAEPDGAPLGAVGQHNCGAGSRDQRSVGLRLEQVRGGQPGLGVHAVHAEEEDVHPQGGDGPGGDGADQGVRRRARHGRRGRA